MVRHDIFEDNHEVMGMRADFIQSFKSSVASLGGEPSRFGSNTTLAEMERVLAQNGLKFTTIRKENDLIKEIEELKQCIRSRDSEISSLLKKIDKIKKVIIGA